MPFIVYSQLISNWQANQLSQSAGPIVISHSAEIYPQLIADWLAYSSPWLCASVNPTVSVEDPTAFEIIAAFGQA